MSASTTISAPDYGRSLTGLGFSLIVRDVDEALRFVTDVLAAELEFRTDAFAALKLCGQAFMLHQDKTYRNNALYGSLQSADARGIGVELRAYGVDPDKAETRAREHGFTVLAGSLDKPHGLREAMLLDSDGYLWIPSIHLPPEKIA
jgi:catechol 2,3-dioxygenase-like lactoylglutathione lyase family enzyme